MLKLMPTATEVTVSGHRVRVPSLRDLLAMKVFAFSQDTSRRMGKDLPDIAYLSVINGLDLEADIRPICDRFGTSEAFQLIRGQVEGLQSS